MKAGVDEAGRGPLAGPVFAAAVILDETIKIDGLNDSKKISERKRLELADEIKLNAISWSVQSCSALEIDKMNILKATLQAMKKAIEGLCSRPELVLVDGLHSPEINVPVRTIVKGDQSEKTIMAASILAKVHRDQYMKEVDILYPNYGFKHHKGYPTKIHLEALKSYGVTKEHRLTFKPVRDIYYAN